MFCQYNLVANPIVSNLINMIVIIVSRYSANVSKRVIRCVRYVHFRLNLKLNQYDRDGVVSLRFCSNFKMHRTTHVMHSRKVHFFPTLASFLSFSSYRWRTETLAFSFTPVGKRSWNG